MYNVLKQAILPHQKVYIVGGAVRDIIFNKKPEDIDIAVSEDPQKYGKQLAKITNGRLITIGKDQKKIIKVVSKTSSFDISPIRGSSIKEDLSLRDFTINAIALNIDNNSIIDPFLGAKDIKKKKIAPVSETIFKKDPIRLIRAYRIAACYNFSIAESAIDLIKKYKNLITESAAERIKHELFKILDTPYSCRYIIQMADSGLLFSIFPELLPLTENPTQKPLQNKKLCLDFNIFAHTMRAYHYLETILNNNFNLPINPALKIDKKNISSLKLAILLHDIGKPEIKKINEDNTPTFEGHDKKGAELAEKICKRLKTSSKETDYIKFIIKNHLKPLYLFQKNCITPITKEAEIKFFITYSDITPDLLIHTIADILGKNKTASKQDIDFVFFGIKLYNKFQNQFLLAKSLPPLITGNDLIKKFSLKPSPLFAKILNAVEEARLIRKISDKAGAFKIAEKIISLNSQAANQKY